MLALLEFDTNPAVSESPNESAKEPSKTDISGPKIRRKITDLVANNRRNLALLLAQKAIMRENELISISVSELPIETGK
jgi:hypothetical protein